MPPLAKVYYCLDAPNAAAGCGPAVVNRTWPIDCVHARARIVCKDRLRPASHHAAPRPPRTDCSLRARWQAALEAGDTESPSRLLENETLDVVLMPAEDETLFLSDEAGRTYLGGLVGEILTAVAIRGGFQINAIVVPPAGDEYASYTEFAEDWVNRADLRTSLLLHRRRRGSAPHTRARASQLPSGGTTRRTAGIAACSFRTTSTSSRRRSSRTPRSSATSPASTSNTSTS